MRASPTFLLLSAPFVVFVSSSSLLAQAPAQTPAAAPEQGSEPAPAQPEAEPPAPVVPTPAGPPAQAPTSTPAKAAPPPLGPLPQAFPTPASPAPGEHGAAAPAPPPPPVQPVAQADAPAPVTPAPPPAPVAPEPAAQPEPGRGPLYRAGHGFVLATSDGDFELGIGLMGQARYRYLDDGEQGLHVADVRHTRLRLRGHLFGPNNRYFVQLAFAPDEVARTRFPLPDTGGVKLETDLVSQSPLYDLIVRFDHLRDANLQIGQFRVPFSRTRLLAPERLLFADRGLVNATFNLDRDIGLSVLSDDLLGLGMLRYQLGAFIGEGRNASAATTGAGDRGFLFTVRAELLPLGLFDTADVIDFERSQTPRLAIGAGYGAFEGDAASPAAARYLGVQRVDADEPPLVDFSAHNVTADVLFKYMGLSLLGAFHFRAVDPITEASEGIGVELSAGYMLEPVPVSLGIRGGLVRITADESLLPEQDELSFAVGYHIFESLLKAQLGYTHRWTRSLSDNPGAPQPPLPQGDELALLVTATL